ncbi:hypothetical protein [Arthrobacter sp. HMWF013]|uniref:hypothetical protein n=1 Tax=Arthrobacter sp. HMWF013 TaxID=2056849 RepID=UPI0011B2878F|nr:hypothetical protein [Arthrobacter sp. HMWF013]
MPKLHLAAPTKVANAGPSLPCTKHEDILTPGNHLRFRVGPETLSGVVDAVMADKSCFWIWADGGMGRRLIAAGDVAAIEAATAQ